MSHPLLKVIHCLINITLLLIIIIIIIIAIFLINSNHNSSSRNRYRICCHRPLMRSMSTSIRISFIRLLLTKRPYPSSTDRSALVRPVPVVRLTKAANISYSRLVRFLHIPMPAVQQYRILPPLYILNHLRLILKLIDPHPIIIIITTIITTIISNKVICIRSNSKIIIYKTYYISTIISCRRINTNNCPNIITNPLLAT